MCASRIKNLLRLISDIMSRAKTTSSAAPAKAAAAPARGANSWKDRLAPEDYEGLVETFRVFDEDGSGTIDPPEITKVLGELGTVGRSPYVLALIAGLQEKSKPINLDEFIDIVASRVGETKTKDGLRRVFALWDKDENGVIDFEEFKSIAKHLKDDLGDEDLLELMHSTHVNRKTSTNEGFTFDEFYQIVVRFNAGKWLTRQTSIKTHSITIYYL